MNIDMLAQSLTNPTVMVIAACVGLFVGALVVGVARAGSVQAQVSRFDSALQSIASSELDIDTNLVPVEKQSRSWSEYWADLTAQTGRVVKDPGTPGRFALGIAALGGLLGFFALAAGPLGGIGGAAAGVALYRVWLGVERNKRVAAIDKQLPTLLSGLRANLAAQSTPQQALVDVADDMPSPLGDELRALKRELNVNVGLDAALTSLGHRVSSREVKFLVSSIQIAVRNGAELGPQIAVIEDIVRQRTRIRQKLRSAVAQVRPTQLLALAAVPFMFAVSLRNPEQRDYWFGEGLLFLFIGLALYVAGAVAIQLMIKSVENH